MRLIDADALLEHKFVGNKFIQIGGRKNGKTLEAVNRAYQRGWNDAIDAIINNAPTIETDMSEYSDKLWQKAYERGKSEARPQGEWIEDTNIFGEGTYECSNCGNPWSLTEGTPVDNDMNFCPNCGAKMTKEVDNERDKMD